MANKKESNREEIEKEDGINNADIQHDSKNKSGNSKKSKAKTAEVSDSKKKASSKKAADTEEGETDSKVIDAPSLEEKLAESQDKYLRLSAEFDNYRKRTLKEKMDLTKTAGESIMNNLLPVMDDFDRALQLMEDAKDCKAMKEGIDLIYSKFYDFLKVNGVKEIKAVNQDFDTDLHEAITKVPAPSKKLKGKVVDVIQKGYYLNDKVIRFAKVVIGE